MRKRIGMVSVVAALLFYEVDVSGDDFSDLDSPEHLYWERPLRDPFTMIKNRLEEGSLSLEGGSEKAFLSNLLELLDVPKESQTLVFSTTSLQLSLISPRSPRAIYFNEEVYVGYIPGGKIEVISMDPDLGGIFYIFEIPKNGSPLEIQRSRRCMNCHSDEDTRGVPGLVIKSVIPGTRGGSLDSFRRYQTGHQIPFSERMGGWYVTGDKALKDHKGNAIGRFTPSGIELTAVLPGERFDWSLFPVATSDVLAHLIHDHQAGFTNRILEFHYRYRTWKEKGGVWGSEDAGAEWDPRADELVRYLLFADEAQLPAGGISGDPDFVDAFRRARHVAGGGESLKDFDLATRLFRYRCSYMIYSGMFSALPENARELIVEKINDALSIEKADPEYAYLPDREKSSILRILRETHPDWKTGTP
ncbi:MAG: hypothetical protein MI807_08375 [Verrucomicrobiales bacterium]|nr:hypothetical protein [Verrucomicrobiales bacterium]